MLAHGDGVKSNAKQGLPVALRFGVNAFRKDIRNRIQKPVQRRSAVRSLSAAQTGIKFVLLLGST